MTLPNFYAGLLNSYTEVEGTENEMVALGGYFAPQGSSAPVVSSPGSNFYELSRVSAGTFELTFIGALLAGPASLGKIQAVLATLQIDQAGSDLTLQVTPGPVTGNTLELYVTDTTTGKLTDISQPGSPDAQGSFVHWLILASNDNSFESLQLPALTALPKIS